jgi:hypothetical protein
VPHQRVTPAGTAAFPSPPAAGDQLSTAVLARQTKQTEQPGQGYAPDMTPPHRHHPAAEGKPPLPALSTTTNTPARSLPNDQRALVIAR